jgi:carboxypeptidase Q
MPKFDPAPYRDTVSRLLGAALVDQAAWDKLAMLSDSFGHRMNGSPGQALAIEWALATMRAEGLENVRGEPVMVPNWIRGQESVTLLDPYPRPLVMAGYGNSVGTPPEGITADAVVVKSLEDLAARGREVAGKIVVYSPDWVDYPHDASWENYLALRGFRISGHADAARLGARAVLLRSIYPPHARQAHTGSLKYVDGVERIPSGALSPEDALMLERIQARGQPIRLTLKMEARHEPEVESANVVGEIVGREKPHEVIVLGCQFDTWDAGVGALDDGCGAAIVWEALRLMRSLDLRPRRTVRCVLFANEENGTSGGLGYRDRHRDALADHVAMFEADSGVLGRPQFRVSGTPETIATVSAIARFADMLGFAPAANPVRIGTAEDIHASCEAGDIPSVTLQGDNEPYAVYHHAEGDMVEAVPPDALARATAGVAAMAYVLAEMPDRLPRGKGEGARGTN